MPLRKKKNNKEKPLQWWQNEPEHERKKRIDQIRIAIERGPDVEAVLKLMHPNVFNAVLFTENLYSEHGYKGSATMTPLLLACKIGKLDVAKFLVQQKVPINQGDDRSTYSQDKVLNVSWSPLDYAVSAGHKKIVELLVDNGAIVGNCAQWSRPFVEHPIYVACGQGHESIVKYLHDHHVPDMNYAHGLGLAVESKHVGVVGLLLEYIYKYKQGVDKDRCLAHALIEACRYGGHAGVMEVILEKLKDDQRLTSQCLTPALTEASRLGHDKVVEVLLKTGCKFDDLSEPLRLATATKSGGHARTVALIREAIGPSYLTRTFMYSVGSVGSILTSFYSIMLWSGARSVPSMVCAADGTDVSILSEDQSLAHSLSVQNEGTLEDLKKSFEQLKEIVVNSHEDLEELIHNSTGLLATDQLKCPRLCILLPEIPGTLVNAIKGVAYESYRLYFLCAHDRSAVDTGIIITKPKEWLKKAAPIIQFSLFVLQAASFVHGLHGLALDLKIPGIDGNEHLDRVMACAEGILDSDQIKEVTTWVNKCNQQSTLDFTVKLLSREQAEVPPEAYASVVLEAYKPANLRWMRKMELVGQGSSYAWVKKENRNAFYCGGSTMVEI